MLGFFPTLYPGELLYSGIARYQIRSGNLSPKSNIEELFNSRTITATADLPCGLDSLVQNLPSHSSVTVENLIQNHTLYPFYAPFLPLKRAKQIQALMKSDRGGAIHTAAGIMASTIYTPRYFRFCPDCLQEDLSKYGETYWHRLNQIQGVLLCPVHKILLQNSQFPIQGFNKHQYEAASQINCPSNVEESTFNKTVTQQLIKLAQNIAQLLENNYPSTTLDLLGKRYQTLLIKRGYANITGRIKQKKLIDDFLGFYDTEFLEVLNSTVTYGDTSNWLAQIVRKHRKVFHPIRHLLTIQFLTDSIDNFFQNNEQYEPFGRSPWLCLNAAVEHYRQPVITDLRISHCLESKKPLGTFICSCGMIYSRSGEDKIDADKLRIGRIITYGHVWEDKLKELVEVKKLGLRATARALKVDSNTIKRYVILLGLTPSWTKNKLQSKPKQILLSDLDNIKQNKREIWLNLQQENSRLSRTEIRKLAPDVYAWLYRNDKKWLNDNSLQLQRPTSSIDRIDWNGRDEEILIQSQNVVNDLLKKEKPVRITISRIGASLGLKALLEKHLDKLPRTKVYLNSVTETVEDFQIRRVRWAVEELERQGEAIMEWKIFRLSGLRENCSGKVRKAIEESLLRF